MARQSGSSRSSWSKLGGYVAAGWGGRGLVWQRLAGPKDLLTHVGYACHLCILHGFITALTRGKSTLKKVL